MPEQGSEAQPKRHWLVEIYDKHYKALLIIPIIFLIASFAVFGVHQLRYGEPFDKDVSLKGGATVTIPTTQAIDIVALQDSLSARFSQGDVSVRMLSQAGRQTGIIVDVGVQDEAGIAAFISLLSEEIPGFSEMHYSTQVMGSALGASFLTEAISTLIITFIVMSLVVLLYFRNLVPASFVVLCAFCDIVMPFAVVVLLGVKLSTAGIAAFLMLIGYSVDTDILLTTRVLKGKEGTVFERTLGAFRTGITMTAAALAATIVGYFVSQSDVIKQIMLILTIGLIFDVFNTWITNTVILRWYLESRQRREHGKA